VPGVDSPGLFELKSISAQFTIESPEDIKKYEVVMTEDDESEVSIT
jgi:hypothetical protein